MSAPSSAIYESRRLLDEYLLFHYGSDEEVMPWAFGPKQALHFAVRTVTELMDASRLPAGAHALDLGCAVGRSSFELARLGCNVTGIDYSHSFIEAARALQQQDGLAYSVVAEGSVMMDCLARVPQECPRANVRFEQGDAMHLRADLGSFDLVHAANLLCRLTTPQLLLDRLPDLVRPGGQLLLTTPCTWLADFTPPENWPAGATRNWLKEKLSAHFTLDEERDLPFVIREHARKFQWTVAWGSRWIRKAQPC